MHTKIQVRTHIQTYLLILEFSFKVAVHGQGFFKQFNCAMLAKKFEQIVLFASDFHLKYANFLSGIENITKYPVPLPLPCPTLTLIRNIDRPDKQFSFLQL